MGSKQAASAPRRAVPVVSKLSVLQTCLYDRTDDLSELFAIFKLTAAVGDFCRREWQPCSICISLVKGNRKIATSYIKEIENKRKAGDVFPRMAATLDIRELE